MIKFDCVSRAANGMLNNAKTPTVSKLGLPAKVALGSMAALAADTFVMKCSDYDQNDGGDIDYCTPLFP